MTAGELEAAVVEPAEQVGVTVEPALLAELVAESVARPGSLPLLQYALTELFEQRIGADADPCRLRGPRRPARRPVASRRGDLPRP